MYRWQIKSITLKDDLITSAYYHVAAGDIATEGHWTFKKPVLIKPLEDVTQQDIISWVDHESAHAITDRLDEQAVTVEKVDLPWMKNAFKPFKD
jgi:hypothetical protein